MISETMNKSSNTVQAVWIGLSSLSRMLFAVVSAAILSRLLTKAEYGTYKQVMYVYTTLLGIFSLGLPKAYSYFLPRVNVAEGRSLVNKINKIFFLLGGLFSILLFLGAHYIAILLKNPNLETALKLFSPCPLFLLPTLGIEGVMATFRLSIYNAVYVVITKIFILLAVSLPVIFYKSTCDVAIFGFTLASIVSCLIALYLKNIPFRGITSVITSVKIKDIFYFSIPLMIASIWGIIENAADQFFVSRYFGQEAFAEFANGSMELPFVTMVLSASSTVLLPLFSKMVSDGCSKIEILNLWNRTAIKSACIIYPLAIYCWIFSELLMTFLYGDSFSNSSIFFKIMMIVNFLSFSNYFPILLALDKSKIYAHAHIIASIGVWTLDILLISIGLSAVWITVSSVIWRIFKVFFMLYFISKCLNTKVIKLYPIGMLVKLLVSCSICGLVAYCIVEQALQFDVKIIKLAISSIIYFILIMILGRMIGINYFALVAPLIKKRQ